MAQTKSQLAAENAALRAELIALRHQLDLARTARQVKSAISLVADRAARSRACAALKAKYPARNSFTTDEVRTQLTLV